MKIALINNNQRLTGAGWYAYKLGEYLEDIADVHHYLIDREEHALKLVGPGNEETLVKKLPKSSIYDNVVFTQTRLSKIILDWRLSSFIPPTFDVYHLTCNTLTNLVYKQNINNKKVITIHDFFYLATPENSLEKIFSGKALYSGTKKADFIITTSKYTKNEVLRHFKISNEKISVIYEGVDERFRPLAEKEYEDLYAKYSIPKDGHLLLHISIKAKRKNNKLLIKVLHMLVNDRGKKDIRLIKIGSFDDEAEELIKKYNLHNYIIRIKRVSDEDLIKFYNISDVFLFPSYAEGFGFPALESMACGTPVIASNRTAIPEVVGDAGILIDPDDVLSFTNSVDEILKNANLVKHFRTKGIERAKQFSWKNTAKTTYGIYKNICEY